VIRQQGKEAAIFKTVFWHSMALASLVALVVMFYAYVIPWAVPRCPASVIEALEAGTLRGTTGKTPR
jgi:hypothetical protein